MKHHVFVYGTLKKGGTNHYLLHNAVFLGNAMLEGFELWDLGSYPAIRPAKDPQATVHAERYETDDYTLKKLDALEDYYGPEDRRNLYDRVLTSDTQGNPGWVYVMRETALETFIQLKKACKMTNGNYK